MPDLTREPGWPYDTMHFTHKKPTIHPHSQKFMDILDGIKELHISKSKDYGSEDDPFANVRMTESFGLPAWIGVAIRMQDKMVRLQNAVQQFMKTGEVNMAHDSLLDDFRDLCNYGGIGAVFVEEWESSNHAA